MSSNRRKLIATLMVTYILVTYFVGYSLGLRLQDLGSSTFIILVLSVNFLIVALKLMFTNKN
jgi:hypothetical protein